MKTVLLFALCVVSFGCGVPTPYVSETPQDVTKIYEPITRDIGQQHILFSLVTRTSKEYGSEEFCVATTLQGGVAFAPMTLCY